jgi:hypothetical protein
LIQLQQMTMSMKISIHCVVSTMLKEMVNKVFQFLIKLDISLICSVDFDD